jgi:molybdate/tungstate transport system substrate-binding protein
VIHPAARRAALLATLLLAACAPSGDTPRLVVFNAGSLARPLGAALDTFAARHGVRVEQQNGGSLETARKLTELGSVPDVIALADHEVFPALLIPAHVRWYATFARNRMVLAYTDRSRAAGEITAENWWRVVQRPEIEIGHSEPDVDPAGYRALLAFQLAEWHYGEPGLAERLRARVPRRNIRPKSADLVALLETGALDYAWEYESVARAAGLRYLRLPHAIDLGAPADSALYARASVRVAGRSPRDTMTVRGQPIVYALAIPVEAPHPELAARFVEFLFSDEGRRILRAGQLDVLERPVISGTGVPAGVAAAVR